MMREPADIPTYSGLIPEFKPNNMPLEELKVYWRIFDNHCQKHYKDDVPVEVSDLDAENIRIKPRIAWALKSMEYINPGHNGHLRPIKLQHLEVVTELTIEDKVYHVDHRTPLRT